MSFKPTQTGERLHVLRCNEGSIVCVLPLLAIADSSEACLIMTASADGTIRVSIATVNDGITMASGY